MSGSDDLQGVTPWISNDDAERLLSGTLADDADDLAPLNTVLNALRSPAESAELVGLESALVAFVASVVTAQPNSTTARTRPMIKKLLSGKALAAIGAVTLVSAGAAAASGDVVPPSLSSKPPAVVASTEVPDESTDKPAKIARDTTPTTEETDAAELSVADEATDADATTGTEGQGPDVNGPAKFGLCTAYAARTKHDDTTTAEADSHRGGRARRGKHRRGAAGAVPELERCSRGSRQICRRLLCGCSARRLGRRPRQIRRQPIRDSARQVRRQPIGDSSRQVRREPIGDCARQVRRRPIRNRSGQERCNAGQLSWKSRPARDDRSVSSLSVQAHDASADPQATPFDCAQGDPTASLMGPSETLDTFLVRANSTLMIWLFR